MIGIATTLVLLLIGFVFGRIAEARHYAAIAAGERALAGQTVSSARTFDFTDVGATGLVSGSVVVANDYFKMVVARLKMIVGGRLRSYESLLERARREAILRMRMEARQSGYDAVINVRLEFSVLQGGSGNAAGSFEVLAYGTGLQRIG